MPVHVVVRDLRKSYGNTEAVRGVNLEIAAGEVFGLLGPNGAGKTTTVECVVGLREPDAGTVEIGGIDARRRPAEAKQRIGVALQSTALPDQLTPREALRLFGAFYRQRETPAALLARFGLDEKADARFATLSGGQRQRLALALAFVNRPDFVLLDEPTTGLDPHTRHELHGEIARMKAQGCTVLLTTHYLEEAEKLCDRIAIVDRGRIVATGTPRELIAGSGRTQEVRLVTARPLAAEFFAGLDGVESLVRQDTAATFRTARPAELLAALTQRLAAERHEIVELHARRATLEDIFLRLTREEQP
jgi:ABC-2 type transport system ATP-binding protein